MKKGKSVAPILMVGKGVDYLGEEDDETKVHMLPTRQGALAWDEAPIGSECREGTHLDAEGTLQLYSDDVLEILELEEPDDDSTLVWPDPGEVSWRQPNAIDDDPTDSIWATALRCSESHDQIPIDYSREADSTSGPMLV